MFERLLRRCGVRTSTPKANEPASIAYGLYGDFQSFEAAANECGVAYEADSILSHTLNRTKVAEKIWLENQTEQAWSPRHLRQLAALQFALLRHPTYSSPQIIDYGGAMGFTYFDIAHNLPSATRWAVVELQRTVEVAKENFKHPNLSYHSSLAEVPLKDQHPVMLLSGVLQCLPDPKSFLKDVSTQRPRALIIDRMPTMPGNQNRLTIHRVDPSIYEASYPTWLFSREVFRDWVDEAGLRLVSQWLVPEDYSTIDGRAIEYSGGIFVPK